MFTFFFFFKQKTAYEMRISDWSSDVCSSDLDRPRLRQRDQGLRAGATLGGECRRCRSGIAGEHLRATKGIVECGAAHIAGHLGHMRLFLANFENGRVRSEEHTSELQSLMRISYAVFCLKKKKTNTQKTNNITTDARP